MEQEIDEINKIIHVRCTEEELRRLTEIYMIDPMEITMEEERIPVKNIEQFSYCVEEPDKLELLRKVTLRFRPESCIIFANTQEKVETIAKYLKRHKYSCYCIHGAMRQKDRIFVMNGFKEGSFRYLIATDVAARGIDIDRVAMVLNYDISRGKENYVHRIGRCGRLGASGIAITFFTIREQEAMQAIMNYTDVTIPVNDPNSLLLTQEDMIEFEKQLHNPPNRKEKKGKELNKVITKLYIYAGKKDKIRTNEIVATICSIDGVVAEDIGVIQILPTATQVEILNKKGTLVFDALKEKTIKGKVRKVRIHH